MSRKTTANQFRADAVLTAAFVFSDVAVPQSANTITVWLVYTRAGASATGYPSVQITWKGAGVTADGNSNAGGGALIVPETYTVGPTAATIKTPIKIDIPDGADTLSFGVKETGDTVAGHLGNCRLLAAYGGEPVGGLY